MIIISTFCSHFPRCLQRLEAAKKRHCCMSSYAGTMQAQPTAGRRSSYHSDMENTSASPSAKRPRLERPEASASSAAPMQRAGKACDACRRGKVRCGGQRPQCDRCMENELPCSYTSPHRRRGPERGASSQINQRMTRLENLLQNTLNELHRGHLAPEERRPREDQTTITRAASLAVSPGSTVDAYPHPSSDVSDRRNSTTSRAHEGKDAGASSPVHINISY